MIVNVASALYTFFSGFGIPAYEENSVPDDAALPYITYSVSVPEWDETASISASVWNMGTSAREAMTKAEEIIQKIRHSPSVPVPDGSGVLWLFLENPPAQEVPTESDNVKVIALNIGFHALCN